VTDDENYDDSEYTEVQEINTSPQIIAESPIRTSKLARKICARTKLKIMKTYRTKIKSVSPVLQQQMLESDSSLHSQINVGINEFNEMISQLKEKFRNTDSRSEKLKILTFLLKSWGIHRIEKEFQTSNLLPTAKELVRSPGILSSPNPQLSTTRLAKCLEDILNTFYVSDEINHTKPGKDFKSVKKDGKWIHVQKRLMLGNLKQISNKFKNDFPGVKMCFFKFYQLQPRHVILAGAAGTHCACVCVQHQNIILMADAIKLNELTKEMNLGKNVSTLEHLLALISCNPPTEDCLMNNCT
jgi:predicted transport protein